MTIYEPTRSGLKHLLRDLREGATYYTVDECAQPWGTELRYRSWTFEKKRLLGWCVTGSSRSAENVLSNFGPISDEQPIMQPLFGGSSGAGPDPQLAIPKARQKAGIR